MRCPAPETWIAFYGGEIDQPTLGPLADHLGECPRCQEEFDRLCTLGSGLRGAFPAAPRRSRPSKRRLTPASASRAVPLAVAATLLLTALGLIALLRQGSPEPAEAPLARKTVTPRPLPPPPPSEPTPPKKEEPPAPLEFPQPPPALPFQPRPFVPAPEPPVPPPEDPPAPPTPAPTTAAAIATLERAEGPVLLDNRMASPSWPILDGQALSVSGDKGRAQVRFPDGTRIELGADTALERIEERSGSKRIQVGKGAVLVEAAHQSQGRAITLVTPHGEARIVGTVLHLNVDPDATRLEVTEGKVELSRAGAGTIDVYGGFVAVAAPGVELAARPSARMLVEPLHRYDFRDGRLPRAFTKGIVEKGPENRLCLAGEILTNATSGGHIQLSEDPKDAKGLFSYTDDLMLSFDYWVGSTVQTLDLHVWSRAQQVTFGTTVWNTPHERWVHVVLRLADFLNGDLDRASRLRPGESVPNLWIQAGQVGGQLFLDNLELARIRPLPPRKKDDPRK